MNKTILLTLINTISQTSPEAQTLVKNYVGSNGKIEQIKSTVKVFNALNDLKETYAGTPVATVLEAVTTDKEVVDQIEDFITSAEELEINLTDEQVETVYQKMKNVKSVATSKVIGLLGARLNALGSLFTMFN
jgi:TusA-related sulfurtransferase